MSLVSYLVRRTFKKGDLKRDAGLTIPGDVTVSEGIPYGPDPVWQSLEICRPTGSAGTALPVIVSVHGGGWVYGDRQLYRYYCADLARRGFAVVNFSYRLAPEHRFPACLEDTCAVFRFVSDHAREHFLDPGSVFAVGDSAGAHLLSLFTEMCADPAYAAGYPFSPPKGFMPRAVALNCGAYRIAVKKRADLTAFLMRDLLPGRGRDPEELRRIDVLSHVCPGFPPAFIMTAEKDFLRDQALPMAEALEKAGTSVTFRDCRDDKKELAHVFHLDIREENARRLNDEECAFFRSFLTRLS